MSNAQALAQLPGRGLFLLLLCGILAVSAGDTQRASLSNHSATLSARLPLSFEANQGQADPTVKFLARGAGYRLALSPDGAALALHGGGGVSADVLRMKWRRANPAPRLEPLDALPSRSHYFIGADPRHWRTDVPNYAGVKYHAVYPGVDLVFYGQQGRLEYDFIVQPGADPRVIGLDFAGAERMQIEANGDLTLHTGAGAVRQHKPVVYQERDGQRHSIAGAYVRTGADEIGFAVGDYDHSRPLVIDPVLTYSTYFGGSGFDFGNAIALDAAGNIYVAGGTTSANFTTASPLQPTFGGVFDGFIAKFNPSGTALIYSTYLGGNGSEACYGLAVDAQGQVYLTSNTSSANFPVAGGLPQTYGGGASDVYVAKLNVNGSALVYSGFLGGSGTDQSNSIVVDASGAAYVVGQTASANFPVKGALQPAYGGGGTDAFVTKVDPNGAGFVYSTYLGGSALEQGCGIAVDDAGNAYLSGWTRSTNFPVVNALQQTNAGGGDIFVSKLNPNGTELLYSTYLGGSTDDAQGFSGNPLALDAAGNVYLTGLTSSRNFPLANPLQATFGGGTLDAFVTKLSANGSALVYSTYLGGSGNENLTTDNFVTGDIAVDAAGQAYLTGTTTSANFPTTHAVQATFGGGFDAFAVKLNANGTAFVYSTYFGGGNTDNGLGIAVDATGNAYLTGRTLSRDLQTVNPLQAAYGGGDFDAFLVKLGADAVTVSAASFSLTAIASKAIVAAFGPNLATATASATALPLPTTLTGTTVRIHDSAGAERAAPLFFVSAQQINYQIPDGTAAGPAAVTVTSGDGRVSSGVIHVLAAAPAIFTANASGSGAAAALDAFTFTPAPFNATQANGQPNVLAVFGTGLGADATDGGGDVKAEVQATLAGRPVSLLYAGSVPGAVGLNQFNVVLPVGIAAGAHTLSITRNGVASNSVTLTIK